MKRLTIKEFPNTDILWNKVNEIIDYINRKENNNNNNNPETLYAIKNIKTGEIIFNARGSAYQNKEAAMSKCLELGQETHKLVEYKLSEEQL